MSFNILIFQNFNNQYFKLTTITHFPHKPDSNNTPQMSQHIKKNLKKKKNIYRVQHANHKEGKEFLINALEMTG